MLDLEQATLKHA